MTHAFDPDRGLVIVPVEVHGPSGSIVVQMAVDTGATGSLMNVAPLAAVGYDPSLAPERVQVTTGSGVEYAPLVEIERVDALGQTRSAMPILAHTLPPSASVDGLLGLDFMIGRVLTIDFREGVVSLS